MAISTGFETQLSLSAEENTYKTPPTTQYFEINQKSSSLSLSYENIAVERIRGDRNSENIIKGTESVAGDITVDLCPDDVHNIMIVSVLCDDTDADETSNGDTYIPESTQRSYTIIQQLKSDEFHRYKGCQFNAMSLTVGATGTIETTFSVIGATMDTATAHTSSANPKVLACTAAERIPFTADDAVVNFASNDNGFVTDFSLSIDNGMSPVYTVGSEQPILGHLGKAAVTGSMTVLFETDDEYDAFVARTETAIILTIGSGETGIKFTMPRCLLTTGTTEIAGDGAVTASFEFTALFKDSDGYAIQFDNHL